VKAGTVVVRSVTKTYRRGQRRVTALHDVSFALSQGELALLVGPSGSGKTTLLNLVAALDRPDCGEIIVGGVDVTGLSRSAAAPYRNERVGFIFQSYNLLPHLLRNEPFTMYMHVQGNGDPVKLATALHTALAETKTPLSASPAAPAAAPPPIDLDTAAIDQTLGAKGTNNGGIYQFSIPRAEPIKDNGMDVPPAMVPPMRLIFSRPAVARRRSPAISC
jgi:ABC-type sugar transport system ATPase subunit